MNKISALVLATALAAVSTSAFAADGAGGFVRAEAGRSHISLDGSSDNDDAYSVRGGYFFNANWAVEGFYSNLGQDSGNGVRAKLDSYGVGVVGKKNFGGVQQGFFVGGRAGIAHTKGDVRVIGFGSTSDSTNRIYVGANVGYDFTQNLALSLNVDHQRPNLFGESLRVTTTTLALEYRF